MAGVNTSSYGLLGHFVYIPLGISGVWCKDNYHKAEILCKALDSVTLKATSTNMQDIA